MLTLRSFFAASLLKSPCGSQFCSSKSSLPLSSPISSSILKQRGSCGGRIFLAAARRQKEAATPVEVEVVEDSDGERVFAEDVDAEDLEGERVFAEDVDAEDLEGDLDGEFSFAGEFTGREGPDYDKDPEFAEILGSCFDDPEKAQARVEERIRKKRNKILHAKTGSPNPVKITFSKFTFSNSYIWFEFYNAPLASDVSLICDAIRSWHIIGRLGGCNSMNMQLSQLPLDHKRPTYDAIQGANVTPTTFYNIGDLEIQDNLARIWVDIGTTEPLLLDILINALIQISADYVGIKQVMFGGSEFESWKENFRSEEAGFSVHKI